MPVSFTTTLIPDPRKSLGKNALCVLIEKNTLKAINRQFHKHGFNVKGHLDHVKYTMLKLAPVGDGTFHLRLTAKLRNQLGKKAGDTVKVRIDKDRIRYPIHPEFFTALKGEPQETTSYFIIYLSKAQQDHYNKWINTAATTEDRHRRIERAIQGLRLKLPFNEMRKRK